MKLRQAIKICRDLYGGNVRYTQTARGGRGVFVMPRLRKYSTNVTATERCRRSWRDHRVPYIPTDDEQRETAEIVCGIFESIVRGDEPWMINEDL